MRSRHDRARTSRHARGGLVAGAALMVAAWAPAEAAAQTQVSFMSGGATGAWYRTLTAMSECLRQHGDVNATVTPTSGGMEAFRRMNAHEADFGFTYQSVMYPAWRGEGRFKGKQMRNLRVVGVAEATALGHWVVSRASGIKSLMDLAGKRFAPGPVGTVTREVNTALLTKLGILDKIKVANVSHGEMVSYLKDGKLDGFALIGSVPIPAVTEAVVSGDVRLLDIGKELDASGFLKANPFLRKAPIPAGTYPRIDEPATTYAENGIFVVNKDVPDAVVYKVTKTLWGKACLDYLPKADRALAQMKEDPLVGLIFPLHPGAARYWKEAGRDVSGVPTPDRAGM